MKSLPDSVANLAIGGDDGADVVQFVGGGNQASVGIGCAEMPDVVFFALPPGRFGIEIGIGAAVHDVSDAVAEAATNFLQHGGAATVFYDVVQERGDGKVFIASGFEHQARDTQEMCNVGYGRAFAVLAGVFAGGKQQGSFKAWAKWSDCLLF